MSETKKGDEASTRRGRGAWTPPRALGVSQPGEHQGVPSDDEFSRMFGENGDFGIDAEDTFEETCREPVPKSKEGTNGDAPVLDTIDAKEATTALLSSESGPSIPANGETGAALEATGLCIDGSIAQTTANHESGKKVGQASNTTSSFEPVTAAADDGTPRNSSPKAMASSVAVAQAAPIDQSRDGEQKGDLRGGPAPDEKAVTTAPSKGVKIDAASCEPVPASEAMAITCPKSVDVSRTPVTPVTQVSQVATAAKVHNSAAGGAKPNISHAHQQWRETPPSQNTEAAEQKGLVPVETSSISTDDIPNRAAAPTTATKNDEPRPWEAAGLSFAAWLEQDRQAFEAEVDNVKRMNSEVDALFARLNSSWDGLQELRVAVAMYVNNVNIMCSSTERLETIAEARTVFAKIKEPVSKQLRFDGAV